MDTTGGYSSKQEWNIRVAPSEPPCVMFICTRTDKIWTKLLRADDFLSTHQIKAEEFYTYLRLDSKVWVAALALGRWGADTFASIIDPRTPIGALSCIETFHLH